MAVLSVTKANKEGNQGANPWKLGNLELWSCNGGEREFPSGVLTARKAVREKVGTAVFARYGLLRMGPTGRDPESVSVHSGPCNPKPAFPPQSLDFHVVNVERFFPF